MDVQRTVGISRSPAKSFSFARFSVMLALFAPAFMVGGWSIIRNMKAGAQHIRGSTFSQQADQFSANPATVRPEESKKDIAWPQTLNADSVKQSIILTSLKQDIFDLPVPSDPKAPPAPMPPMLPPISQKPALPADPGLEFPSPNKLAAPDSKVPVQTSSSAARRSMPVEPVFPYPWSIPGPTAKDLEVFGRFIEGVLDPQNTLDVIQGRSRLLKLKQTPKSIHVSGEGIIGAAVLGAKGIVVHGKTVGAAVLHLCFATGEDKTQETELTCLVRVLPDLEARGRSEQICQALEQDVNRTFSGSQIQLKLLGNAVLVTGQVNNLREAAQVVQIVAANTPWAEKCSSGTPYVVNMLHIAGSPQVTLKVVIAEMSRKAARALCAHGIPTDGAGSSPCWNEVVVGPDYSLGVPSMDASRSARCLKSLAAPQLMSLCGQTATLRGTGEILLPLVAGESGNERPEVIFDLCGVELTCSSAHTDGNHLRLNVTATAGPGVNSRVTSSVLEMGDGQTFALIGLIPQSSCTACEPRPNPNRMMPLLKRAASADRAAVSDQEVVIFVTPEILLVK